MKDLYKILSGKIIVNMNGSTITVGPFSFDDYYLSEIYAENVYNREFESGTITESEAFDIVMDLGWWSQEEEEVLSSIPKKVEQMKVDYFNQFYQVSTRDYIKHNIELQMDKYKQLIEKKNYFFNKTCEYAKDQAKLFYLIENCSVDAFGNKIDFNTFPITKLLIKYNEEVLNDDQIRNVAKQPIFKGMWWAHKEEICKSPITSMKTSLINWARVYDNVYESTECPSASIIDDDYALDGWFTVRRKKQEEERKKNGTQLNDKIKNAGEVFLRANTKEDIASIYNMNDREAQRKIKLLENDLNKNGSIEEQKLSSNKEALGMAKTKMASEAMKRR